MKWVALVFALLLLTACGGDSLTGSVVDVDDDEVIETSNQDQKKEVGNLITGLVAKKRGSTERAEAEQRRDIEDDLQTIYAERVEVLAQKRVVLGLLNDPETTFEERQEYQKDLDVLRARESEMTLRARILDTKLEVEKKRVDEAERIAAYKKLVKELEEDREKFFSKLKEIGKDILDLRVEMVEPGVSYDDLESLREDLEPLEKAEGDLLKNLRSIEKDLEEKLDYLGNVGDGVFKSYESLILERNRIVEEIGVVKNSIVEQYLRLKSGDDKAQERINDLEDQEDDLEDELQEVTEELEG